RGLICGCRPPPQTEPQAAGTIRESSPWEEGSAMIDTHIHVVPPGLPGVGPLSPLLDGPAEEVARRLRQEVAAAGARAAPAMGRWNAPEDDPLGVVATLAVARSVPGLYAVGVADPSRADAEHLRRAEEALAAGVVKALKGYLGYLHYGPDHAGYRPYY